MNQIIDLLKNSSFITKMDELIREIAKQKAVESVNGKIGKVVLNKDDIGLPNVENTADINKNVNSANKLTTPRKIAGTSFDGTEDINIDYNNLQNIPHIAEYTIDLNSVIEPDDRCRQQ